MGKLKLNESRCFELSVTQKRLFFLNEIAKNTKAFNMPLVFRIKKPVQPEKFKKTVHSLIRKHEVLSSIFKLVNKVPYQVVADEVLTEVRFYKKKDFLSKDDFITKFVKPFRLDRQTPLRIAVIETAEDEQLFVMDTHEILMDCYSQQLFLEQLKEAYLFGIRNDRFPQFDQYLRNLQEKENQELRNAHRKFWIDKFKDKPEKLSLPLDFSRPLLKTYKGSNVSVSLNSDLFLKLKEIAEETNTGLFNIILSIFTILLGKISNQEDISVGTIINERNDNVWKEVIGNLAKTVVLRNKLRGNQDFNTFLEKVTTQTSECYKNLEYRYEDLLDDLNLDRNINRNPLFDVFFEYSEHSETENKSNDEFWEACPVHRAVSKYDLTLKADVKADKIIFNFEYATDLFRRETISRFTDYFINIIKSVSENQSVKIKEINFLTTAEKDKLVHLFNDTYSALPESKTVSSLFQERVMRYPQAIALKFDDECISYGQLNERVEKLGGFLKENGLKKGDIVASLIHRSPDYFVAFLATIKNEATFLPIYPNYPVDRINYILHESKASFLIGNEKVLLEKRIPFDGKLICLEASAKSILNANPLKTIPRSHNNGLYVIFTSGTTGFPKGVVNTEAGLLNRLYWGWKQYGFGKNEVCCQKTGIGFADHIAEMFLPLLKGVPTVIIDDEKANDGETVSRIIDENRITRIVLVPSLLQQLVKLKTLGKADLESLKYVFSSGDRLTVQLANKFYNSFHTARLINLYGSAEVSADVTFFEVPRFKVAHILSYFKNLTETEERFRLLNHQQDQYKEGYFTTPNIELKDLIENFKISKISERFISLDEYYRRLEEEVIPYTINTASPTFIGHMTSALPDFVHEVSKLISQMNQNQVKIETSKSLTLLEREAIAMLHRLFYRMSNNFYDENIQKVNTNMGIVSSGGTTANISAILAARNRALFGEDFRGKRPANTNVYDRLKEKGYKDMVIIGSELMHYSFKKTASLLGFGSKNIMYVPNDEDGVMSVKGLENAIEKCNKEKLLIIAVVGIAGSTERGSIDPLKEIAAITSEHGLHFHVDAAWGGAVMFSRKYRKLLDGIDKASSITICGHKQLFLPQGISVCLFKDINYLTFNSVTANYQALPDTYDFGRFTLEGSRPAMSLCLHAALRVLGMKGYELLINNGIEKANIFATLIKSHPGFQLLSCQINILNYRYIPLRYRKMARKGALTAKINEEINAINEQIQQEQFLRAKTFVSKTTIKDANSRPTLVFRTVISNPLTTKTDFVKVLNDQLNIIEDLYGENNRRYSFDTLFDQMETEYEVNREKEISVYIGKPLQNTQILILDKCGKLQPQGVWGEICIGGSGLAKEYLNNAAETAKSFISSKLLNGKRIYKTGDIGRWSAYGNLEYLGRKDDQVKIKGFRIELDEVIFHLNAIKPIDQSVVISRQIGNEKHLIAYYVAHEEISQSNIIAYLSEQLPAHMIPSFFVRLEKIPVNTNGKTDKSALPDPDFKSLKISRKPESDLERTLLKLWAAVLSKKVDTIGTDDNFFSLGGHSLWILELTHEINTLFGTAITAREIILKPTIKQQAALLNTVLS